MDKVCMLMYTGAKINTRNFMIYVKIKHKSQLYIHTHTHTHTHTHIYTHIQMYVCIYVSHLRGLATRLYCVTVIRYIAHLSFKECVEMSNRNWSKESRDRHLAPDWSSSIEQSPVLIAACPRTDPLSQGRGLT
jgi:hypothetical protein